MAATVVRDAALADAPPVAALLAELGYPTSPEDALARLARPGERVLVAEVDGAVAGLLALAIAHQLPYDRPVARVVAMVVGASVRRAGAGRALMDRAAEIAREAGCEGIELTSATKPERDAAHRFYQALGYRATSVRYRLPCEPR